MTIQNDSQIVAQAICGYDPFGYAGQIYDKYYEMNGKYNKMKEIIDYAWNVFEISLTVFQAEEIYDVLELESEACESQIYWNYMSLGKDTPNLRCEAD